MAPTQSSPPKRMTRARAKAVQDRKVARITTPGAKAVSKDTTANNKRKAPTPDGHTVPQTTKTTKVASRNPAPQPRATKVTKTQSTARASTRSSRARTATGKEDEPPHMDDIVEPERKPKPRGRPKKTPVTRDNHVEEGATSAENTADRMRAKTDTAKPTVTTRGMAPKKIVTFKNKENIIEEQAGGKEVGSKTGEGQNVASTKETQKPAPKFGPWKREKSADTDDHSHKRLRSEPLSPKKGTQVAKGNAGEASGLTGVSYVPTPSRRNQSSPEKLCSRQSEAGQSVVERQNNDRDVGFGSSVDELQLPDAPHLSPSKPNGLCINSSPARRLPPSPSKELLKSPPKRFVEPPTLNDTGDQGQSSFANSLLKSPQKIDLGGARTHPAFGAPSSHYLNSSLANSPARRPPSPIKNFGSEAPTKTPASTSKPSLLQSSARRPPSSIKDNFFGSAVLGSAKGPAGNATSASGIYKSPQRFNLPLPKNLTSSFRAARSPEAGARVHTKTQEEQDHAMEDAYEDELRTAPSPFTPEKQQQPLFSQSTRRTPLSELPIPVPAGMEAELPAESPTKSLFFKNSSKRNSFGGANRSAFAQLGGFSSPGTPSMTPPSVPAHLYPDPFIARPPAVSSSLFEDSEDELQFDDPEFRATPGNTRQRGSSYPEPPQTPSPKFEDGDQPPGLRLSRDMKLSMTSLAKRFCELRGATPAKGVRDQRNAQGSLLSAVKQSINDAEAADAPDDNNMLGQEPSHFEEAMDIYEDQEPRGEDESQSVDDSFRLSKMSEASQEYGDENAVPDGPSLESPPNMQPTRQPATQTTTCTPARVFAPPPRVTHTTSKVPLKPAADECDSSLDEAKHKRSKSLSGTLTPQADLELQGLRHIHPPAAAYAQNENTHSAWESSRVSEVVAGSEDLRNEPILGTPNARSGAWSVIATPGSTPSSKLNPKLLTGAVVYVDAYTNEGTVANGSFADLLTRMGARYVKQWNWTPEAAVEPRPGITHVLFKNGSGRTMEKVRAAKGIVMCVGVNWIIQ